MSAAEYGFELNLGLSLGMSLSTEKRPQTLTDAQFLGAPQGNSRSYLPMPIESDLLRQRKGLVGQGG
ncbi:hypothetical protein [Streptomyces sp. NPDC046197]|uniref:hypothetical protein n=1 Tax=Streptomyces sp. NPDC046197 TaxID=3154337 RepID=UPI0034056D16